MDLRNIIYALFVIILALMLFIKRPEDNVKALLFFILAYFSTFVIFKGLYHYFGIWLPRIDRYLILGGVSLLLIFGYSKLRFTKLILMAALIELSLIATDSIFIFNEFRSPASAYSLPTVAALAHFHITDILNYAAFGLLIWNWFDGRILNRFGEWDKMGSNWNLFYTRTKIIGQKDKGITC